MLPVRSQDLQQPWAQRHQPFLPPLPVAYMNYAARRIDVCGFVSFHDCSWNGGTCSETAEGAACVAPGDYRNCGMAHCDGASLSLCVSGRVVTVDCREEGMQACYSGETPPVPTDALPECGAQHQADCVFAPAHCAPGTSDAGAPDAGAAEPSQR